MLNFGVSMATVPIHTTDISATTSANTPVRVAVCIRPIEVNIPGELRSRAERTPCIESTGNSIVLLPTHVDDDCGQPGGIVGETRTEFHHAFGSTVSQQEVFDSAVAPLLAKFASGQNVAVMAYGQTGSGKTYTMGMSVSPVSDSNESSGIIPRALEWVFTQAPSKVTIELAELYNGKVNALTAGNQHAATAADALSLLQTGLRRRHTAATNANAKSSRSHAVFTVTVLWPGQRKTTKLRFADLAGSERLADTQAEGKRLAEAKAINKSLLTLGRVVAALASAHPTFVPYRDDPLTFHLRDVLGGDAQTLLLACVAGNEASRIETASTLGFAKRALLIKRRKSSGMPAGALGSATEEMQKRIVAEAKAEKLRATVDQLQATIEQLQLQIAAASALTVDAGMDAASTLTVNAGMDAASAFTANAGIDAARALTVDARNYTALIQSEDAGNYTNLVHSGNDKRYTVLVKSGYAATDAAGTTTTSAASSTHGCIKPQVLVRKVCAPASAQSAGADAGKTAACIKPQKLVRKFRARASAQSADTDIGKSVGCIKPQKLVRKVRVPAKHDSKGSLQARIRSILLI
ncbi:Chromosome-associated kinesin kif4a [Coemansia sp. RSA 678]|nr:Chromosome-associated kinesin kif4a [Coemansia sp. RSA 678]